MNVRAGAPRWAGRALTAVLERVSATADDAESRFPLYAEPDTGRWTTTSRGSWTGGFWAGLLWLRALASGSPHHRAAAAGCTERLGYWVEQDTATRGLILWYGTALAAGAGEDPAASELRDRAAHACLGSYDAALGMVPWGGAFGGPRLLARADGVPGLVPLLARAPGSGVDAAAGHLACHLGLCLSEDPPRPAWRALPEGGWAPCAEPAPGWSRTAAWLLLGVADALYWLPPEASGDALWDAARQLIGMRLVEGATIVPRQSHASGPLDTSAAAIEAVAALKLAALTEAAGREGESRRLAERAGAVLRALCADHLSPSGALLDGCYDAERGTAVWHELVWGDFFLALGLAVLTGLVEPFAA